MVDETRSPTREPRKDDTPNALRRALEQTEHRNRALVDAMPDAVLQIRRDGHCLHAIHGQQSALPVPLDHLVGRSLHDALEPRVALPLVRAVADALDERSSRSVSLSEGDTAFVAYVTPVDDDVVLAFLRDRRDEERIRGQLRRAERLASVGMLAAGVAHEINNPLSYLSLNIEAALERCSPPEGSTAAELAQALADVHGALVDALDGAGRVRDIVGQLKSFSAEREPHIGPVRLEPILEAACRMVRNQIRHRAVFLTEVSQLPRVLGNASRLEQVFVNLLVNAAQAIPDDASGSHVVRLAAHVEGDHAVVEISDTGQGIAPQNLERIFDPFFSTKPIGEGTGLGLAMAHETVIASGGRIHVKSRPGQGSTFSVELPTSIGGSSPWPPPRAEELRARARVLVVDDEPLLGRSLARVLGGDYDVTVLQDGREAVARARAGERFDVIFCDVMMPLMSGVDVYAALQEHAPELAERVVFISGGAFGGHARAVIDALPNPLLTKPLSIDEVRAQVKAREPTSDAPE